MTVSVTAGTKFYIGPVVDVDEINEFERSRQYAEAMEVFTDIIDADWEQVFEIESLGELGDNTEITKFTAINNRRTRSFKTTKDAGPMSVVCGVDETDDGQLALMAASREDYSYAFKVVYSDEKTIDYSPTTDYFAGMVSSTRKMIGSVADITKRTFNIEVNTAVFTDETDPTGS